MQQIEVEAFTQTVWVLFLYQNSPGRALNYLWHGDATVAYGGETMSGYDATQKQRAIERKIRESKRKLIAYDEGIKQSTGTQKGELQMRYAFEGKRLSKLNAQLDDFCSQTGLQKQYDRARVMGTNRVQMSKISIAKSTKAVDNSVKSGIINMNRQTKNTGVFAGLQERMSKKHIRKVASECGIDLKGLRLNIDKNEELLYAFFAGRADYENVGEITFFPNAFKSKEELVRTLFHEKTHVEQFKSYGVEYVQNNNMRFEKEAYEKEEEFINKLKENGVL